MSRVGFLKGGECFACGRVDAFSKGCFLFKDRVNLGGVLGSLQSLESRLVEIRDK
jgi:hypothetical protein